MRRRSTRLAKQRDADGERPERQRLDEQEQEEQHEQEAEEEDASGEDEGASGAESELLMQVGKQLVCLLRRILEFEQAVGGDEIIQEDIAAAWRYRKSTCGSARDALVNWDPMDTPFLDQILDIVADEEDNAHHLRVRYQMARMLVPARLTQPSGASSRDQAEPQIEFHVVHQMIDLCVAQADRISPGSVAETDRKLATVLEKIRNNEHTRPGSQGDTANVTVSIPEEEVSSMCAEFEIPFEDCEKAARALRYPLLITAILVNVTKKDPQQALCKWSVYAPGDC